MEITRFVAQPDAVSMDVLAVARSPFKPTLLEAAKLSGPWVTNLDASVVTNLGGASYSLTATTSAGSRFYRILSPR